MSDGLPPPAAPFDVAAWMHRWPTGAHKTELFYGVLVSQGNFDERDVEIAQRTYPGRQVFLNDSGNIEIHPSGTPAVSIFDQPGPPTWMT